MHVDVKNQTAMAVHLYALCVNELFINWPHNMDTLVIEMLLKTLTAGVFEKWSYG